MKKIQSTPLPCPKTLRPESRVERVPLKGAQLHHKITAVGVMASDSNISGDFLHRVVTANGLQVTACLDCLRELAFSPHLRGLEAAEKAHKCTERGPTAATSASAAANSLCRTL